MKLSIDIKKGMFFFCISENFLKKDTIEISRKISMKKELHTISSPLIGKIGMN